MKKRLLLHRLIRLLVVAFDVWAPWLGFHRARGFPDHIELTISFDFTDEYRFMQVVVLFVHLGNDTAWCFERLTSHRCNHFIDIGGFSFSTACFHMLMPM